MITLINYKFMGKNGMVKADMTKLWSALFEFHKITDKSEMVSKLNMTINMDNELYKDGKEAEDPSNELYIEIEGEDWKERKKRIKTARKKMSTYRVATDNYEPNYCNELIMMFVYTVINLHPWIIPLCEKPLYIDRTMRFISNTYRDLTVRAQTIPDWVRDKNIEYLDETRGGMGEGNLALYEKHKKAVESFTRARIRMQMFAAVQYGASGDEKYLGDAAKYDFDRYKKGYMPILSVFCEKFHQYFSDAWLDSFCDSEGWLDGIAAANGCPVLKKKGYKLDKEKKCFNYRDDMFAL